MEFSTILAIVIIAVSSIGLFLWWLRRNDDYWKKRGVPYAPRQDILSMFITMFTKPFHEILCEMESKYGPVHGAFEFRKPILTVSDPVLLKDILVKDFHIFNYHRDVSISDDVFSNMLVLLKGEDWKRVRSIISPAFTSRRMRKVSHVINESCTTLLETLAKYCGRPEPVDVKRIFGAFVMDVIANAAFATKIDSHNDPENAFVKNARGVFDATLWIQIFFFALPSWITRIVGVNPSMNFFEKVVLQVIEERKKTKNKYDDLLQLLLDAREEAEADTPKLDDAVEDECDQFGSILSEGTRSQLSCKRLSENELIAQCVQFFIAGYDTTASTLTFMAYELALNPECQEKLIKEVELAFAEHAKFDYDVIRNMKYLDCVVTETLRKYPSLQRSERTACEDYKLANTDIVVEKGTFVGFNIYCMHHDPQYFPNPERFQPERFFPENATHPPYSYLPFGGGPRNCLGIRFALLKMKLCICNILKNYRFKNAYDTKVPLDFELKKGFTSVANLHLMVERT